MFIYSLGKDRAIAALHQRAARLEAEISSSDAYRRAFLADLPDFPRIFGIEDEYAQAMAWPSCLPRSAQRFRFLGAFGMPAVDAVTCALARLG